MSIFTTSIDFEFVISRSTFFLHFFVIFKHVHCTHAPETTAIDREKERMAESAKERRMPKNKWDRLKMKNKMEKKCQTVASHVDGKPMPEDTHVMCTKQMNEFWVFFVWFLETNACRIGSKVNRNNTSNGLTLWIEQLYIEIAERRRLIYCE